jgi:hypothetical protein
MGDIVHVFMMCVRTSITHITPLEWRQNREIKKLDITIQMEKQKAGCVNSCKFDLINRNYKLE